MVDKKNLDPKLQAALKGVYDNLSDELKEKAKACKTMEELMVLAGKEGIELPDEALDAVAGGGTILTLEDCDYTPCDLGC